MRHVQILSKRGESQVQPEPCVSVRVRLTVRMSICAAHSTTLQTFGYFPTGTLALHAPPITASTSYAILPADSFCLPLRQVRHQFLQRVRQFHPLHVR